MTYKEAVKLYAEASSRDTVRDRAIVRTVQHTLGVYAASYLATAGSLPAFTDEMIGEGLREAFVRIVDESSRGAEVPRGVVTVHPGKGQHIHINYGDRLHAEIREDGHTYIGDDRID